MHLYSFIHTHAHARTHTHSHAHTFTRTHADTHTHTHTHTHTRNNDSALTTTYPVPCNWEERTNYCTCITMTMSTNNWMRNRRENCTHTLAIQQETDNLSRRNHRAWKTGRRLNMAVTVNFITVHSFQSTNTHTQQNHKDTQDTVWSTQLTRL